MCVPLLYLSVLKWTALLFMPQSVPYKDVKGKIEAEFKIAQTKFEKALSYKSTCNEALVALAQLEFDRAMMRAGYPKHK
jgi:hypothetical protein